jgi:uncharacterized membrane protein YcaP (DUF421 family)
MQPACYGNAVSDHVDPIRVARLALHSRPRDTQAEATMDIPDLGSSTIEVMARSAIVYLVLLTVMRFGGRRQIGQMSKADLLLILLIANGVSSAMVGQNITVIAGLLAAGTLIVIDEIIDRSEGRFDRLRSRFEGEPTVLVSNGAVDATAMARERVTLAELLTAIRQHGIADLSGVDLVFLETTGSFSVIPRSEVATPGVGSLAADAAGLGV